MRDRRQVDMMSEERQPEFPLKPGSRQGSTISTILSDTVMIYISYQNSTEDRHKRIKRGKEEFTPPLFPDNTILYLDDPVESIGKL